MNLNGSPNLYYKYFKDAAITSVVIPINEEYYNVKVGINPNTKVGFDTNTQSKILKSKYSNKVKNNLLKIYSLVNEGIFSNKNIQEILNISETSATKYIKILLEINIIKEVQGLGKGRYKFI